MLIKLVQQFPPSDKRDTTEKLAIKIRGIVETLLKQLLGKAPNEQVLESLSFMEKACLLTMRVNNVLVRFYLMRWSLT
jgi:hypothetical protein